jgi:hypothetical protein
MILTTVVCVGGQGTGVRVTTTTCRGRCVHLRAGASEDGPSRRLRANVHPSGEDGGPRSALSVDTVRG